MPVLLVFALINRPHIFDLRPGHSFVEYLLGEGFDVLLLDWGEPDEEDADQGLEFYVCDALPAAIRETRRATGAEEVSLLGWCIGGTLVAMHAALEPDTPVRNLVCLTTPIDTPARSTGAGSAAITSTPRTSRPPGRRCPAWRSTPPTS